VISSFSVRVVSLNLRAYPNHGRIGDLADLIARHTPDVLLLQECRRSWLDTITSVTGLTGLHSHDLDPPLDVKPADGCAIAIRSPLQVKQAWRLLPERFAPAVVARDIDEPTAPKYEVIPQRLACRYSARTILAEILADEDQFLVASLHATPGSSRGVHNWKPFFHGAVAIELSHQAQPFIFAIDANEPESETLDAVHFHARPGVLKFAALLGLVPRHRARDLLREELVRSGTAPATPEYLAHTYTTRGGKERHFDHVWATPEFMLDSLGIYYEDALAAGTDHALIVAEVTLRSKRA
jgi:hypothetical protein